MEKKVNLNFIQRIFNTKKNVSAQNLLNIPIEDKFVKNNIANEKIQYVKEKIENLDYLKFLKSLDERKYWSDSVNNINYYHKNDLINCIGIYFKSPLESEDNTNILTIDEFINLLTQCTAVNIEKNKGLENEYKKHYLNVIKYLKENEFKN